MSLNVFDPFREMPRLPEELASLRESLTIIGIAVISADGFIARHSEERTSEWAQAEDYEELQKELSQGGLSVMGKRTHDLYPRPDSSDRRRLVFSKNSSLESCDKNTYINPSELHLKHTLEILLEKSSNHQGKVYVLGGEAIYDYFLNFIGYDVFKLTIENNCYLEQGIKLFSRPYSLDNLNISGKAPVRSKILNDKGTEQFVFS